MKAAPPILDIQNLHIRRGNAQILRNVSWCVKPGEHWVMLGANGSGKTSLLSALTGYLMPTDGNISLLGQAYGDCDWRELRKRIGLVSSSVRQLLHDQETAIETVISGRHAMIDLWVGITRADRFRAKRLLRSVECGCLADRPWSVLSQGERQRVLIARALMAKPLLLILDEPCAGLDPAAREHFLQFLQRLGRSNKSPALILVTHHVEEIMPVFTHVLLLKQGRVLASGRKSRILTSTLLSDGFVTRVKLATHGRRYHMTVAANRSVVI